MVETSPWPMGFPAPDRREARLLRGSRAAGEDAVLRPWVGV